VHSNIEFAIFIYLKLKSYTKYANKQ